MYWCHIHHVLVELNISQCQTFALNSYTSPTPIPMCKNGFLWRRFFVFPYFTPNIIPVYAIWICSENIVNEYEWQSIFATLKIWNIHWRHLVLLLVQWVEVATVIYLVVESFCEFGIRFWNTKFFYRIQNPNQMTFKAQLTYIPIWSNWAFFDFLFSY